MKKSILMLLLVSCTSNITPGIPASLPTDSSGTTTPKVQCEVGPVGPQGLPGVGIQGPRGLTGASGPQGLPGKSYEGNSLELITTLVHTNNKDVLYGTTISLDNLVIMPEFAFTDSGIATLTFGSNECIYENNNFKSCTGGLLPLTPFSYNGKVSLSIARNQGSCNKNNDESLQAKVVLQVQ